jgi:hypothetical protein
MVARAVMSSGGTFLLGIILLAIGAVIEPARSATVNISEAGESLIALGLTFILASVGYFLAWANPTA